MKYVLEVVSKVTVEVDADNVDEAVEKAGSLAWTLDPDEQDIKVVRKEEK